MGGNVYELDGGARPAAEPLEGAARCDLCVVGGGVTGLSAALHGARAGLSVILLEGRDFGHGASGRNGGQIIPGLRAGVADLAARWGAERARALWAVALAGRDLLIDLAAREGIDCDLKTTGHLLAGLRPGERSDLEREVEAMARILGRDDARVLDRAAMAGEVAGGGYACGLLDPLGGHLHPLKFTRGLARAAARAGARLHAPSPVRSVDRLGRGFGIATASGQVRADAVVLACDALIGDLDPRLAARIVPIMTHVIATAPLDPARAARLIPRDRAVSDTKYVVDYFRRTADNRILFGGGETYSNDPPSDVAARVRPHLLRVFPDLADVPITHGWSGLVSLTATRLPHVGHRDGLYYAHGYSGQGVALSVLAGAVLIEALSGAPGRLEVLAALAPPPFPGGTLLRRPLHVLGALWYGWRDRARDWTLNRRPGGN